MPARPTTPAPTSTPAATTPTPRRSVLAAALGGAAALIASALGRPAPTRAAAGQAVLQGQVNNAGATTTTVSSTKVGDAAFIGQTSNSTGRGVYGKATATSGINVGVFGTTASASGRGVFGKATKTTGSGQGVRGEVVSPDGYGVYGKASTAAGDGAAIRADGGVNTGVHATTSSASSWAVSATNMAPSSSGGAAIIAAGGDNIGLIVTSDSEDAIRATSTSSYALMAESASNYAVVASSATWHGVSGSTGGTSGVGVWGQASAVTGTTYGVYGETHSTDGRGVRGHAYSTTGTPYGVYGTTASAGGGIGVRGWASAATGVTYGLYGSSTSASGYGLVSGNDALVSGDLTVVGAKTGYVADLARNGGASALRQGDVVTLVGAEPAVLGTIPLLVVRAARRGDPVIGVVDRRAEVTTTEGDAPEGLGAMRHVKGRGTTVQPGEHLLVVTLGAFAVASVDASGGPIRAGDRLSAGARAGRLSKAAGVDVGGRRMHAAGEQVGYALGDLADGNGTIGVFVNPH